MKTLFFNFTRERRVGSLLLACGSALLWPWVATAQDSATVTGRIVSAESGEPIPAAHVQIEGPTLVDQENWRIRRPAEKDGTYSFTVPAGEYELWSTAAEYSEFRTKIRVNPGQTAVHDIRLTGLARSYAYRVEPVELPRHMIPEVSGIDFTPQGRLVAVNRRGEIWIRELDEKTWRRFAYGLYEPFGVVAENEDEIFVVQRPEITRVRDTDSDGEADTFETIDDSWGVSGNYHEFTYGLDRDRQGNFYAGLGMVSAGEFPWVRGPLKEERVVPWTGPGRVPDGHRSVVKYQGWVFKVSPDGSFDPLATGFRQPLGIGVSPDNELFVTDVSGAWVPTSLLHHVEKGKFYGHPDGLKWDPAFQNKTVTPEMLEDMRTLPIVYLPRGPMGSSPGEPAWDTTGGKFGPFTGQMFLGDVTSLMMRVDLEKVAGAYQGAVFPFVRDQGLRIGGMRNEFAPDGSLYVAQTVRGWMAAGEEGIQRIVFTGENPVEIYSMRLTSDGFALSFTEAMDSDELADPSHYRIRRFQYDYHILDGSLQMNQVQVPVTRARPTQDGSGVELSLLELLPGFVYELEMDPLRSRRGRPLLNPTGYYTLNRLLTGETFIADSILKPEEPKVDGPVDLAAGEQTFKQYCMVCHQADGRGSVAVGTPNLTEPGGRLTQPDEVLLQSITEGKGDIMPAFGNVLPAQDIRSVLAYIRENFQPETGGSP